MKGGKLSEEHKKKISEARKGLKHSEETKKKMSISSQDYFCSEETKKKISNAKQGHLVSLETRQKISNTLKGRKLPEEHKKKIGLRSKGKVLSEETKEKMSKAHKGKKFSEEHKRKISKSRKGFISSEETRKNLSLGMIKAIQNGWNPHSNYKNGFYDSKNNGKVWYRSSYELAYMKYLDLIEEPWEYEKHRIDLGDCFYLPDFYLPYRDEFHEVKGYPQGLVKIEKFRKLYPVKKLIIIGLEEMKLLEVS